MTTCSDGGDTVEISSRMTEEQLIAFIDALPKAEHHLHLDGSPNWHTMHAIDPDRFPEPPPSWEADFRFVNFEAFEGYIRAYAVPWLTSAERFAHTAHEVLQTRAKENVRYAEVSFAALAVERSGIDIQETAKAIQDAFPTDMETRLYIGLHHKEFESDHNDYLRQILDSDEIDGIDLHGPEEFPLRPWIKQFWADAKNAGKLIKAHASELTGPTGVREAIEDLGVTKIQHGVQAALDPAVVKLAAEAGASFDVCPVSNVKLKAVPSMEEHPIMQLEAAGVICTINSDDPLIFGNDLRDDYKIVAEVLGATPAQLAQFAKNSFTTADWDKESINAACQDIDAVLSEHTTD